uniref:Chondroitin sulfate proteoglycan 4ba n=1 Tax=Paramormyrops kingsleyae TaxID=1676925 RepID=A0A3B3T6F0_9TELE|nr:chondroitin sulfate proteoglycan 4-like [Paramormyrops kingsleyae]
MDFVKRPYGALWSGLLLLLSLTSGRSLGASFYGDGFVQLKTAELSNRTSLHIRFRTSSSSGMLFLAAGQSDYCLVELSSGHLQVRLELGSGERLLRSERRMSLNDMAWHSVELHHEQYNVTLILDKHSQASLVMPGPEHELNIQEGLYVGGTGGLDKPYLTTDPVGFRGCIDEVLFNQHNLLSSLRPYYGFKNVHEVSLGCSPLFLAGEDEPISFFSSKAYISFPPWNAQQEWIFQFVVHTSAEEGIILYNSARHDDFIAMEIRGGLPVAIVGKGGTKTELRSLSFVNDQKWHHVKLHFTSKSLELTVDEETVITSISSHSRALHLKGSLFVGGIDESTRSVVRRLGLVSVSGKRIRGGSFKGCLKDINVNGVKIGLPNVMVSKDISVGCEPDKEKQSTSTIVPENVSPFVTPTPMIYTSTLVNGLDKKHGLHFLTFRNLIVPEGGRASLESKHIKVNLDFKKLGIRQSQIVFKVDEQPVHGQLRLDVDQDQEENTFSMLDLWHGRVMYIHGGSEDLTDFFMFSVFTSSKKEVPSYLKGNKLYRYDIIITPTNDAPELSLPEGNLFLVLENSKKPLTTEVLKAIDIDSNYTDLVYSVLGNLNADAGFLENDENPGKAVTTFSHHDLEKGKICYVHHGVKNSRIVFRVSDGDKVSNTVVLRILAIPLEYKISNNTGVSVLQGDMALIGTRHLAVQTNAIKQMVDIRYDVIEPPQFGELQRLHTSGEWKLTNTFSQRLLEKERLRYLSTFQEIQTHNITDHFRCKITVGTVATDEISFSIIMTWVQYKLVRNKLVEVDKVRKVLLDSEHLYAIIKGVSLLESELHFRLLSLPRRGNMLLNGKVLKKNSTFSQKDISDLKVQYELVHRVQDDTKDKFNFQVFSKHAHSASYEFQIGIKADANAIILKNEGLSVMEGESKLITKDELFSETLSTKTLYYSIIDSPKHGKLKRINLSSSSSRNDNITAFTNQEILEERIVYVHDDSETTHDQFTFIVSTSKTVPPVLEDENGAVEGIFHISVQLVNDEKPVRVIDKVFHVVRDGQRLLTLEDLCYHDTDSDFDDGQLIYTRRGIPMGDLVLANDTSHRLFQFQQKDLEQKRVLFIHHGVSFGRFVLFVSDGKHYASTLLDVHAEDAYLKIENNTGILVQKGQEGALRSANLSVTTNLDVRDNKEITYNLFTLPKHGGIYCNGLLVDSFTQHDLKMGAVVYRHDDSRNLWDVFQFTVKVKEMHLDSSVNVKVYLESHQQPPRVIHRRALLVEEGKPVKINKRDLEVIHEDNLPLEIIFTVKVPPSYGYLRRFAEGEDRYFGTQETPIQTFSQKDVNAGNVQYVQVGANQLNDTFVLDVTNGITEVHDIRMSVDVIPSHIPLEVSNITLNEGAAKALTKEVMKVANRHFSGLNFQYYVSEGPYHGRIEHSQFPGVRRTAFTRKQVEQEFMYYVHDNSETTADNFTIIANDTDIGKQSLPRTVFVNVRLLNDEPPVIKANRILRVWVDSITEITSELKAQDEDSPPKSLEYIVTPPSMGHLALKSSPHKPILNFTQAHIDQGQLVFVHSGAMSGGFNFQVNDGINFSPRQIFSITARALILTLERNLPLKMFPGSSTPISAEELLAVTNDNDGAQNRSVVFNVISPPKLGRLVKVQGDNRTAEISSFTQTMVDEGEIIYEQSRAESVGWVATDFFSFTLSSPPASLEAQIFNIDISYENTDPEHKTILLANTGADVTEGEKVLIDKAKLDASNLMAKLPEVQRHSYEVWYQVKSLPQHGVIIVGERNLTKEKPKFSQYILNKFGITYQHDNSETTYDNFVFDAWLNLKSKPAVRPLEDKDVVEESFNITIIPVNDQPPVLITKSPGLSVVQGDAVVLAPANLNVVDLDNPPEDINYTVISKPNNGFLAMKHSLNESILTFTQADINNEKVYFVQDGSPQSGVFYFSVTDGKHRPVYKLFNLEVNEITISLINNTEVELEQGQTSVILSNEHLAAETSGRNSVIQYQVTQPPHYGKLLISNEVVHLIDQNDLRLGKLSYNMTDLSSAGDSFEFTAFTSETNLTKQIVKIAVRPLIQLGMDFKIPNGILVKLRKDFIDASALTVLSGTDPQFEILSQPKYGKVVKVLANEKGIPRPISSFSFQDVEQGKVAIEEKANMTDKEYLNDSFVFVLKAEKVQPSRGEFHFTIVPFDPSLVNPVTTESPVLTTKLPTSGQTTVLGTLPHTTIDPLASSQRPHKTLQKFKGRNRWGSHQRNNTTASVVPRTTSGQQDHPLKITPVRTESFPKPASDPLFIILPLLACLLLIIIFIVLILVFRRRREKRARPALTQDLIATPSPSSPYLGQPERSLTVPSVVVTPLSPSCPGSPVPDRMHDGALAPVAGPQEASLLLCSWSNLGPETVQHCRTTPPTLRSNQYWV